MNDAGKFSVSSWAFFCMIQSLLFSLDVRTPLFLLACWSNLYRTCTVPVPWRYMAGCRGFMRSRQKISVDFETDGKFLHTLWLCVSKREANVRHHHNFHLPRRCPGH